MDTKSVLLRSVPLSVHAEIRKESFDRGISMERLIISILAEHVERRNGVTVPVPAKRSAPAKTSLDVRGVEDGVGKVSRPEVVSEGAGSGVAGGSVGVVREDGVLPVVAGGDGGGFPVVGREEVGAVVVVPVSGVRDLGGGFKPDFGNKLKPTK